MRTIGPRCHELRIQDKDKTWRIQHRIDADAIVITDVFQKATQQTPDNVINKCKRRLAVYDKAAKA